MELHFYIFKENLNTKSELPIPANHYLMDPKGFDLVLHNVVVIKKNASNAICLKMAQTKSIRVQDHTFIRFFQILSCFYILWNDQQISKHYIMYS